MPKFRILERARRLFRRKPPAYVIIYDGVDADGETPTEEYYGYFSSPAEASYMWAQFAAPGIDTGLTNVKLCLIVEDWS